MEYHGPSASGPRSVLADLWRARDFLARGSYGFAERSAKIALHHAVRLRDGHLRGSAHSLLAGICVARGDHRRGIGEVLQALRHLAPALDPLEFENATNLCARLLESIEKLPLRISALLAEIRRGHPRASTPYALLRWLEGLAMRRRGSLARASRALNGSRRDLLRRGRGRQAARVTADLVAAYLADGRKREARVAIRETARVLDGLGLDPADRAAFDKLAASLASRD